MSYVLKEEVELWVAAGVDCDFKQGFEDIFQHLLEVGQLFLRVVDITLKKVKVIQSIKGTLKVSQYQKRNH